MKTKIIPVAADNEKDVITLQKIATKSFTAMFGPYHEPKPLKHILMRHMPYRFCAPSSVIPTVGPIF